MKKCLWVLSIIIIFLFGQTAYSQSDNGFGKNAIFTDLYYNKTPAYTLVPVPNKITVNPDQKMVNVNIFVSGEGYIQRNRLIYFYPPDLLDPEAGKLGRTIKCNITSIETIIDTQFNLNDYRGLSLPPCYFMNIQSPNNTFDAPPILTELYNPSAPIYLKLNISKNAPYGDTDILLVFTYTNGTKWYQDKEKITVHVNNPIEENRQILVIISTILVILLTVISVEDKFKNYLSSVRGIIILIITIALVVYLLYYVFISL